MFAWVNLSRWPSASYWRIDTFFRLTHLLLFPIAAHIYKPGVWYWLGYTSGSRGAQWSRKIYTAEAADGRGGYSVIFHIYSQQPAVWQEYWCSFSSFHSFFPPMAWSVNILTWRSADITRYNTEPLGGTSIRVHVSIITGHNPLKNQNMTVIHWIHARLL